MSKRKAFLLRIDPALLDALQDWAQDEFRSLNGQLEFLLRRALRESGRLPGKGWPDRSHDGGNSPSTENEP